MNLFYPMIFAGTGLVGIAIGLLIGFNSAKLREVSDLVDPKNPGKIVMRSGDSFYVFPGGYEYVPRRLLVPRS